MYDNNFEICDMPLSMRSNRTRVEKFLAENGLRLEDVDYYAAVTDDDGNIIAGGGLKDDVIKCIAVGAAARETGLTNRLISHLIRMATQQGVTTVKVYTKPENRKVFESMGFSVIAAAPCAILMENGVRGINAYCDYLRRMRGDRPDGAAAIVMNANPFTLGHRYLVEQAATMAPTLYVIAVREDRGEFSYAERLSMIQAGCRGLDNVVVVEGSDYAVSEVTFPTYFLKQVTDATDTHITLDLDLFARHIAPALGVTMRCVGSEPVDQLTARYNELMLQQLPPRGITVNTVERLKLEGDDQAVSASRVRQAMQDGSLSRAAALVPGTTLPAVIAHMAADALRTELHTTPKPGLVDRNDNGAHSDMNLRLMLASIDALLPHFVKLAQCTDADAEAIRQIGIAAEKDMLQATAGVNTHRGALFAMGLTVHAAARLMATRGKVEQEQLRQAVMQVAAQFAPTAGTHGNDAVSAHHVAGALDLAKGGYEQLFNEWLPAYRGYCGNGKDTACHRLLLLVMSTLDDTNVIHRVGYNAAQRVKQEARALLDDFSLQGLEQMNRDYIALNISPGGSADMVALTIFICTILN